MQALALIDTEAPDWKYVCKVWPQPRTDAQNLADLQLATQLGIEKNVIYTTNVVSRNFMPYLIAACDIYAAPSRLEGFGMLQVEAGACGKPVIGMRRHGDARHDGPRRDGASGRRWPRRSRSRRPSSARTTGLPQDTASSSRSSRPPTTAPA